MGFIKAGFTGGFLGIVLSIADIFVNSRILEKLSSIGLYLAKYFGKACINTEEVTCTLTEKFTTILATIVGNTIAYFIIFALISLGFSVIKMWLKPKPKEEIVQPTKAELPQQPIPQAPQVRQEQAVSEPEPAQPVEVKENEQQPVKQVKEVIKEIHPKKKTKISKKSKKK